MIGKLCQMSPTFLYYTCNVVIAVSFTLSEEIQRTKHNIVHQTYLIKFVSKPVVSSINKTDRHEILLKVSLNTIPLTSNILWISFLAVEYIKQDYKISNCLVDSLLISQQDSNLHKL
jgi:hypothetical protein